MLSNQPPFLEAFATSLNNLQQFNTSLSNAVAKDKQDKDSFLQYVNNELSDINVKIKALEDLINTINTELANLRSAASSNTAIIGTNDSQMAILKQQLVQLQTTEAQLRQQLDALQKDAADKESALQQQINANEAQIAQLNASNRALKGQSDALTQQLMGKSQTDAEQAAAVQKLSDDNRQALETQAQENNVQIVRLQKEIEDKDAELAEITRNNSSGLNSITAELNACKAEKATFDATVAGLTAANNNLTEQNDKYEEIIKNATTTINGVVASLNDLLTQIPQAQDRTAITKLFKEINDEIVKLNGLLSGSQQVIPEPVEVPVRLPDNTQITMDGEQVSLGTIRQQLRTKQQATTRFPADQNKYYKALTAVNAATTAVEVIAALYDNRVEWKNNKINGGRSNKKYNKSKMHSTRKSQQGGFTYDKPTHFFSNKKSASTSSTSKTTKTSKMKISSARGKKSARRTKR